MRCISTMLLLLVSSSLVIVHARTTNKFDSLATRLAQLLTNPANADNYNEINRFDSEETYFPKRHEISRNTPKSVDVAIQTSDEIITERAEKNENPEDLMGTMFKAMFKLMGQMMRDVFKRR